MSLNILNMTFENDELGSFTIVLSDNTELYGTLAEAIEIWDKPNQYIDSSNITYMVVKALRRGFDMGTDIPGQLDNCGFYRWAIDYMDNYNRRFK